MKFGSNIALEHAVHSNPNLTISRYGREAVIDALQGQQDWQDTLRTQWLASGLPANQHDQWINQATSARGPLDPRLFQFNRMDQPAQKQFWNDMTDAEKKDFMAKYNFAVQQGLGEKSEAAGCNTGRSSEFCTCIATAASADGC